MTAWGRFLAFAATFLAVSACTGGRIESSHSPPFFGFDHESTIEALAFSREGRNTLERIVLTIEVGEISRSSDRSSPPSPYPLWSIGARRFSHVCEFDMQPAGVCRYTFPEQIGNDTLIGYEATAEFSRGRSVKTPAIAYASGAWREDDPSLGASSNFVRPVHWNYKNTVDERIDVMLLPDARYWSALPEEADGYFPPPFIGGVNEIVETAFFSPRTPVIGSRTSRDRQFFNLWVGPKGARFLQNRLDDPVYWAFGSTPALIASMDTSFIVHPADLRDAASYQFDGYIASVSTNELRDTAPVFVHELGHVAFGLSDEYCCDGGYPRTSVSDRETTPNVFATKELCQSEARRIDENPNFCVQIADEDGGSVDFWRIDDSRDEVMAETSDGADWRNSSGRAFDDRLARCVLTGRCYE